MKKVFATPRAHSVVCSVGSLSPACLLLCLIRRRVLVLMCQWFAPTKLRITFETEGKGKLTPKEISQIVRKDENGNVVSLDIPNKFVLTANHQACVTELSRVSL